MSWPDNKKYQGEYANGKKHGQGVMTFPNEFKTEMEGLWIDDVFQEMEDENVVVTVDQNEPTVVILDY